jgi:hypothetical protein
MTMLITTRIPRKIAVGFMLICCSITYSQEKGQDGIILEPTSANVDSYYYGEPFNLYFRIENTKNTPNYYYRPAEGINFQIRLKNLKTGYVSIKEYVPDDIYNPQEMRTKKPTESKAYKANELNFYPIDAFAYFGSQYLTDKKLRSSDIIHKMRAIPVGDYELEVEYTLMPGSNVIKTSSKFKILPIPEKEKEAFQRYVQAMEYAGMTHFYADRNYSETHSYSFENFVKDFPNSVYANHAFLTMVREIYMYAQTGPTETQRNARLKEYVNYYDRLRNDNIKMEYVLNLPDVVTSIPGRDAKKELNGFLNKIKNENPDLSKRLIQSARVKNNISGLTNYAIRDNR